MSSKLDQETLYVKPLLIECVHSTLRVWLMKQVYKHKQSACTALTEDQMFDTAPASSSHVVSLTCVW